MNPVLLKPETRSRRPDHRAGPAPRRRSRRAITFATGKPICRPFSKASAHSSREADLIIVEGAGSPAEANLRDGDLANMGFAAAADLPALLIGDIHRGGVIASIVGTFAVLDERRSQSPQRIPDQQLPWRS